MLRAWDKEKIEPMAFQIPVGRSNNRAMGHSFWVSYWLKKKPQIGFEWFTEEARALGAMKELSHCRATENTRYDQTLH